METETDNWERSSEANWARLSAAVVFRRPKCPYKVEDKLIATPGGENLVAEISLANHDGTMSACSEAERWIYVKYATVYCTA